MSVGYETDRDTRAEDQQALEEIRGLFARYRRIARHGVVSERAERDESADRDPVETEEVSSLPGR
jgi:hypothetical protein